MRGDGWPQHFRPLAPSPAPRLLEYSPIGLRNRKPDMMAVAVSKSWTLGRPWAPDVIPPEHVWGPPGLGMAQQCGTKNSHRAAQLRDWLVFG